MTSGWTWQIGQKIYSGLDFFELGAKIKTVKTKEVSRVRASYGDRESSTRLRILAAARDLFLQRGFVRVTSDEIAQDLGISKATLYKTFPSKEEILRSVVRGIMNDMLSHVEKLIRDEALGFVEKMVALFSFLAAGISQFGPILIRDLQKSVPDIWKEIDDFRRDKIFRNFKVILEAGREEGFFREDVDLNLLLQIFAILIQEFVNPAAVLRSGRSPAETFESIIKVFFQGILTDKGRRDFSARTPTLFGSLKEDVS
jgi:AcrR family transcriptional regulator